MPRGNIANTTARLSMCTSFFCFVRELFSLHLRTALTTH